MFKIWTYEKWNRPVWSFWEKFKKTPNSSQRKIAEELGFSLGKLNYCLKALQKKGFVKVQNFKKQKNKIKYLRYIVTPKGIAERTKLTINFMRKKMAEYDQLRKELKAIKKDVDDN